jgi:hypothetical protein
VAGKKPVAYLSDISARTTHIDFPGTADRIGRFCTLYNLLPPLCCGSLFILEQSTEMRYKGYPMKRL